MSNLPVLETEKDERIKELEAELKATKEALAERERELEQFKGGYKKANDMLNAVGDVIGWPDYWDTFCYNSVLEAVQHFSDCGVFDDVARSEKQSRTLTSLINRKFTSGNSVDVERITITRDEWESITKESKDHEDG